MNYKDDPWDWTSQIPQAAPLSNQVTPGQATPAQVVQGQPGIIDGFVKPMATQKAIDYANTKVVSPLFSTIGSDMSALGAGITGDMSAANVGNSIAANMTADPMGALLSGNGAFGTAAPAVVEGTTMAAPLSAAATGTAAAGAGSALMAAVPYLGAAYGVGKLLRIW